MYKKLLKNISLISLGTLASKLIVYLMIPLYTNILTTTEYGTTDLIFTTVSLLTPIFSLEISNALMRFLLDKGYDREQVFNTCLVIMIISIIVFFLLSPITLCFSVLSKYYWLFVFYYLSNLVNGFVQSFARGGDLIKEYSIAGIIQTFVVVILNVIFLIVLKLHITGYLLAYSIGAVISVIYLVNTIHKKTKIHIELKRYKSSLAKELLFYSVPLIPNSILWWVSNSSDKYILTYFTNVSDVGIYSVAYKIPTILSVLSSVFITAWQISSVEDFGSEKTTHFFQNVAKKYLSFNAFCTSCILLILKPMCRFLFAKDFYSAWMIVPFLIVGYVYYSMSIFMGTIYTAAKKTKMVMVSTLVGSGLNIILNFIFIPKTGMYGAAIATAISYVVIYTMRKVNSSNIIKLKLGMKDILYGLILFVQSVSLYINNTWINIISFIVVIVMFVWTFDDVYVALRRKLKNRGE